MNRKPEAATAPLALVCPGPRPGRRPCQRILDLERQVESLQRKALETLQQAQQGLAGLTAKVNRLQAAVDSMEATAQALVQPKKKRSAR